MKNILFFSFLLSLGLQSQIIVPDVINLDSFNLSVKLNVFQDFQTSSIRNEFSSIIIKGGTINKQIKDNSYNKHREINRIGREFNVDLFIADYAFTPFKQKKYALCAEFGYHSVFSGIYSKDLFGLTFYGNQTFLQDTAQFSGSALQGINFQNFGLGFIDKKTKSYLSLNLINVQRFINAKIYDGSFMLNQDSTQAELNLHALSSMTYQSGLNQGLGVALNASLNMELPWIKDHQAIFQFNVRNLGFAQVKKVNTLSVDTTLSFSGFTFDDFIAGSNSDYRSISWLDTLGIKSDTTSQFVFLPLLIQFGKVLDFRYDDKVQSFFGIKMYPSLNYIPKVYLGFDYKLISKVYLGVSAAYGGFGVFRSGIYANYRSSKINVGLGTEDLYGIISKKGFGQMIMLQLRCEL